MPETITPADQLRETVSTKDRLIEIPQKKFPGESKTGADEASLAEVKKPSPRLLQSLSKLKPLLPILSGTLRMVDHGAVQALAHLLNLASDTGAASAAAQEELQQGLAEIQSSQRTLHLQVQDHTVEIQRLEDQITLLKETTERHATEQADLAEKVRSLNNLVRLTSVGLGILLVILITLVALLLTHH